MIISDPEILLQLYMISAVYLYNYLYHMSYNLQLSSWSKTNTNIMDHVNE